MVKRKRLEPDDRLDWRDTNMPVIRRGNVGGKEGHHVIPSNWINQYSNHQLNTSLEPEYKHDESYWWNRKSIKS